MLYWNSLENVKNEWEASLHRQQHIDWGSNLFHSQHTLCKLKMILNAIQYFYTCFANVHINTSVCRRIRLHGVRNIEFSYFHTNLYALFLHLSFFTLLTVFISFFLLSQSEVMTSDCDSINISTDSNWDYFSYYLFFVITIGGMTSDCDSIKISTHSNWNN